MWFEMIGVAGIAATAAMMAIPAVRQLSGSVKRDWMAHELDFDEILSDRYTFTTKSGSYSRVYKFYGDNYDTKPEQEQFNLWEQRREFQRSLSKLDVKSRYFGDKRRVAACLPEEWPSEFLQITGDAEAELFKDSYDISWFMLLTCKSRKALNEADSKLFHMMSAFKPIRLSRPEEDTQPCPLTGFIKFLIDGDLSNSLRSIHKNISANIPASNISFHKTGEFITQIPNTTYNRILTIIEWPEDVSGRLVHELMRLPGEIEISDVVLPMRKEVALAAYNQQASTGLGMSSKSTEAQAMMELITEGQDTPQTTQFSIVLRGKTLEQINELIDEASKIMSDLNVKYIATSVEAPVTWYNRHPDRDKLVRPLGGQCEDVPAALFPFETSPIGLMDSYYGRGPVRMFRTPSGQAYSFQYQFTNSPTALGHYICVAPSRSGKSVLLTWLMSGLAKFPGVVGIQLDSKEGSRYMIELFGGKYYSFDKIALNPLDCEDTELNRQNIRHLMKMMLGPVADDLGTDKVIEDTLNFAFRLPRERRTFDEVFPMAFKPGSIQEQAFLKWVTQPGGRKGPYAHIFNAKRDGMMELLTSAYMVGINMNEVLDDEALAGPVVAYIGTVLERMAKSGKIRGFNLLIEECANLLRNKGFAEFAKVAFQEYAKLLGSVGMVFQSPVALEESGVMNSILTNTAAFMFYPAPKANLKTYHMFNLTKEQELFIQGKGVFGRKLLLAKQDAATGDEESLILDVDLTPIDQDKKIFLSGPAPIELMEALQDKYGDEWRKHISPVSRMNELKSEWGPEWASYV